MKISSPLVNAMYFIAIVYLSINTKGLKNQIYHTKLYDIHHYRSPVHIPPILEIEKGKKRKPFLISLCCQIEQNLEKS